MRLTLQWHDERGVQTRTIDAGEKIEIGRNPACHVVLNDSNVSRRHAVIRSYEDAFYIQNRSTRSSLLVNGSVVAPKGSQMLRHGDHIQVGPRSLRVATIQPKRPHSGHPVQCSYCRRIVDLNHGNCPHCGQNLAGAVTQEYNG